MINLWSQWKSGFEQWEGRTADTIETWLKSPLVLQPLGSALTLSMKAKATADRAVASIWSGLGLPTRRDQERTLHALNQLNSRLIDLEERLVDLQERKP